MTRRGSGGQDGGDYEVVRDELVDDFEAWLRPFPVQADASDLGMLLDWKKHYRDGRLDVWTCADVTDFLLGWCPRRLSATADQAHGVPATLALAMSFLETRGWIGPKSDAVERLTEHALGLQADFMIAMSNPANFGMAKSIFTSLELDPNDLTEESLAAAMVEFNAQPEEVRRAVSGTNPLDPLTEQPRIGPVTMPDRDRLRVGAAESAVLAGFNLLAEYFAAPGRTLTKAGNIKLSDARVLVDRLTTGDRFELDLGEHVFHKRSSTKLAGLDHWQWWARTSGALRRQGNKLVGVKSWQRRCRTDPLQEVSRAFDVLIDHGPLVSYIPWIPSHWHDAMDLATGPMLGVMLDAADSVSFDQLLDLCAEIADHVGRSEYYPGARRRDLAQLLVLLERAGVVRWRDHVTEETELGSSYRIGGTVELTDVGVHLAVDLVREEGVIVDVVEDPSGWTLTDLVDRVHELEPDEWWAAALAWLGKPAASGSGVAELLLALASSVSPGLLAIMVLAAPERLASAVDDGLRDLVTDRPPPDEIGSVAAVCFRIRHDALPDGLDSDAVADATMVTLAAVSEEEPSLVAEMCGNDRDACLLLVQRVGTRLGERSVALLDALGRHHPDKVVAKAARKELFRVRSRLASTPRDR